MELDLQNVLGLHVQCCSHWLRPRPATPTPRYWPVKMDISIFTSTCRDCYTYVSTNNIRPMVCVLYSREFFKVHYLINLPCFRFSVPYNRLWPQKGFVFQINFLELSSILFSNFRTKILYLTVLRPMFAGERGEGAGGWGWGRQQGAGSVAQYQGILAAGCCNTNVNRYVIFRNKYRTMKHEQSHLMSLWLWVSAYGHKKRSPLFFAVVL